MQLILRCQKTLSPIDSLRSNFLMSLLFHSPEGPGRPVGPGSPIEPGGPLEPLRPVAPLLIVPALNQNSC